MVERGGRFVARRIARIQRDRRIQFLVVQQREEGHPRGLVSLDAGAGRGEAGIGAIAHAHPGFDVGRRGAIHHELGAAVVDVVERREDGDARRVEPDLDVAGRFRFGLAHAVEHGPRRAHDDPGRSRLQLRDVALAHGPHDVDAFRRLLLHRRLRRLLQSEHRVGAAALFERHLDAGELAAGRFDQDVERRRLADEAFGPA